VILDWGTSRLVRKGGLLETRCGDAQFMAPEVVSGNKYSGFVADVWSAGVILYHLLTGTLPFADPSIHEVFNKVQLGIYTIPNELSKGIQDLLSQMLCLDTRIRITAKEIKKHCWVNNGQATLRQYPEIEQRMSNTRPANEPEDEIVRFLTHLGWGSSSEVRSALSSPE
jgi:serine/threonine protein kinase